MADITPRRLNIQTEETAYKASVSEATMTRVGASNNFINRYQHDSHAFNYNSLYRKFQGVVGADGVFFCLTAIELVGCAMWNRVGGSSGATTLDLHWFNNPGSDQGTIFSTKPSISSSAIDGAYFVYDAISNTDVKTTASVTPARFAKKTFAKGSIIIAILDAAMPAAQDMCFRLYFRPINDDEV